MTTDFFQLQDRTIIEISGLNCKEFLQGLLTNDANKITEKNLIYSFMLNAQGRFLYDFFIFEKDGKILLDCYFSRVGEIVKKLNFYKLRAKIEIKKNEEIKVFFSERKIDDKLCLEDPRSPKMKYRAYDIPRQAQDDSAANLILSLPKDEMQHYHYLRIINKIPESEHDLTYEKSFVLEFGFDNLNAIDYNKGCYVGQEPTARIHHLGQIRKEIIYIKPQQKLEKNTEITCEDGSLALALSSVFYNNEIHALALKRSA
jgi:folate-binding protein YgfZ